MIDWVLKAVVVAFVVYLLCVLPNQNEQFFAPESGVAGKAVGTVAK